MKRALPLDRIDQLTSAADGLTTTHANAQRTRYGLNTITETTHTGWRYLLRETAADPMLWFLLLASLLFAWVGERTEALVLLVALIPFFGMDAYLHRRTQASIAGLSSQLASQAVVLRDGQAQTLAATELVPGDVVIVETGTAFPADGIILHATNAQVDEATLTGEAHPVRKFPLAPWPPGRADVSVDGAHWGFAGTRLLTGSARVLIVFTGAETLYGEIVRLAVLGARERTPLQRAVASLVTTLIVAAVVICVMLAWVRYRQGHGLVDALLSALTLAVAAIPEEFPVVLTFFLGAGIYRLAKRQALVRRAVVVENIGRVTAICSDKTGTLTEGRLRLTHRFPAPDTDEPRLLALAAAASRRASGDPMDLAILEASPDPSAITLVASFPFTEARRRETNVIRAAPTSVAATKGAPEVILSLCDLTPAQLELSRARILELADSGHKVIGCAWRELADAEWAGGEPDRGFRFAGLLAFEDPVRAGVAEAIQSCAVAGIKVIMITGDHPATARAVAKEIGLGGTAPRVIDGDEFEQRLNRAGGDFLQEVDVVARALPTQKLALVRALQARGAIVAVTGDGVNDVPALQAADIGIAMGERGTRSAHEVASIVLLDDNFRSIVRAIAEGRQLFTNLRLSFQYLLMIHIPLVVTAALIPLAGYPILYLPVHIVWLEMIIHPTALLVFQNLPESTVLGAHPTPQRLRFFNVAQWLSIIAVGGVVTLVVLASYDRSLGAGYDVEHARAMALVALTVASAGIAAVLSRLRGAAARIIVAATVAASVIFVQVPVLSAALHLRPLHIQSAPSFCHSNCVVSCAASAPAARRRLGNCAGQRRVRIVASDDRLG